MTVPEIMNTIHEQGVENEVFELLTQWMIEDRYNKMVKIGESEATIRAINKIATQNKEEIIKGLESVKAECGKHLDEGFAWICKPIDEAIKMLKREPCWISVSERLPEKRGLYIVTEKEFHLDDREYKGKHITRVEQVEYYNGRWQRAKFFEVVAWQPLPEPYEEVSE